MSRFAAALIAALVCAQFPVSLASQVSAADELRPAAKAKAGSNSATADHPSLPLRNAANPNRENESYGDFGEHPPTRITFASPAPPVSASWPMHERIAWAASIILAVAGYIGIVLALRTLARIDRHTRTLESLAESIATATNAALLQAQGILNSERPWLLAAAEPSAGDPRCFNIIVSNRGRSPAEIIALTDRIAIVEDEKCLPRLPEYSEQSAKEAIAPLILLPGEFTIVQSFAENDLQWVCKTPESRRRIELSEDQIFVHGRVTYRRLMAPRDEKPYITDWCCRFIYGDGNCRLLIAGPPEYSNHI